MRKAVVLVLACSAGLAGGKKGEWVKGVPFTTDWNEAIKEAKGTGKILLIYNGWEGADI